MVAVRSAILLVSIEDVTLNDGTKLYYVYGWRHLYDCDSLGAYTNEQQAMEAAFKNGAPVVRWLSHDRRDQWLARLDRDTIR